MQSYNGPARMLTARPTLDALALEYQGDYGTAHGDLQITDLMNNPTANGVCRVFGLGFQEQPVNLFVRELRSLFENLPDPPLVR